MVDANWTKVADKNQPVLCVNFEVDSVHSARPNVYSLDEQAHLQALDYKNNGLERMCRFPECRTLLRPETVAQCNGCGKDLLLDGQPLLVLRAPRRPGYFDSEGKRDVLVDIVGTYDQGVIIHAPGLQGVHAQEFKMVNASRL